MNSEGAPRANAKSTIYVGGIGDEIDEAVLVEVFSTFGDIIDVQLPSGAPGDRPLFEGERRDPNANYNDGKHRGYAFITFGTPIDAQDAIDNMDMNELRGKTLKVNLARPLKGPSTGLGNRAVWETEEWLKAHGTKPANSAYGPSKDKPKAPDDAENAEQQSENGDGMEE
ncbi:hypothetical protein FRC03_001541 [Tulasnella sp. 419]|nr:hypothetical protein FRC02_006957 [Tulasnella sp. 418]KAG8969669.1 hypothetical protein FRC03_001541 [Tulasnella sp. 419]